MGSEKPSISTLSGVISLDDALSEEQNMLIRLTYWDEQTEFLAYLLDNKQEIENLTARHLCYTRPPRCQISHSSEWTRGSYNMCLPIDVYDGPTERVIIRFPLPYKVGENFFPGNADEKLRCEAATYAWIHENCPDVPIPKLWGFALSNGQSFTTIESMPLSVRFVEAIRRRLLAWAGCSVPCRYFSHWNSTMKTGYLLLDHVGKKNTSMLSESWPELRNDTQRRQNLFRDLSRIMLSLGRIPLPRIGSFTIDRRGVLSLTNRPLTLRLQTLENEGIPSGIGRRDTYTSVEAYTLDLIQYHDNRLRHQPNAVDGKEDGQSQMAALACIRSILPHFLSRSFRNGPFVFTLTDIHQSNIFVDDEWHITSIIDLEWACSLPVEMQQPPYWLNDKTLDTLHKDLPGFDLVRKEFMDIFRLEELLTGASQALSRADIMEEGWLERKFFFFHALESTVGLLNIFQAYILPLFTPIYQWDQIFDRCLSACWGKDGERVLAQKVKDKEEYDRRVKMIFADTQT